MLKGIHASPPQSVFSIQSLPESHQYHENEKRKTITFWCVKMQLNFAAGKGTKTKSIRKIYISTGTILDLLSWVVTKKVKQSKG